MKTLSDTATPKLFIGIDIHKRSWYIFTATDLTTGKGFSTDASPEALLKYVEKNYSNHQVYTAYEAGCCGYWAHRAFESYGWKSIVFNPADISRTGNTQYQKTDQLDAKLICRELKDNRLRSIGVPDIEREQFRALFRRRNDLTKELRRIKSQIKSQLLYLGIKIPEEFNNPNWTKDFIKWLWDLNFMFPTLKEAMDSRLNHYLFIEKEKRHISNQLRAWCRLHYLEDYKLLRSIPGIGPIVACGIITEIGDLRRFKNIRQLLAYVGLIPGAWQSVRFDPAMEEYVRKHHGKERKAVMVKVAHKLLNRAYAVIRTQIPYQVGVVA